VPDFSHDKNWDKIQADTTPVEVIFMRGSLFKSLFYTGGKPDLEQYRHCAHVRNINTRGITSAGTSDTGLFSILHSRRSGPTDVAQGAAPRSQAVHLLSLENIDTLTQVIDTDLVAFISLYRWTYLCQPPLSVNFIDSEYALRSPATYGH
jgi:hypothetical protein